MNTDSQVKSRIFFGGLVPPIVTPLSAHGSIDTASLARFARALKAAGVDGVLALGSTGEGAHLTPDMAEAVVGTLADTAELPIMANVAALSTADAVAAARRAKAAGADTILAPPPAGFGLSQTELGVHYEAIAEAVGGPVFAYHVPVRVPTAVGPALVGDLVARGILAGVKDSSGDLENHRRTRIAAGDEAILYSGSETCIDAAVQTGFNGAIPGLANIYPRIEAEVLSAAREGRLDEARDLQEAVVRRMDIYFAPLGNASFSAVALAVLKTVLVEVGIFDTATLTAPLSPATDELRAHVSAHLERYPADIAPQS